MRYFLLIVFSISSCFLHANESLGKLLFAVHATDDFPSDGILHAGYGNPETLPEWVPNVQHTLHFSIGELVRPVGTGEEQWMTWENKLYAIVVPLENLFPQLINLNCYDTFTLGDLYLSQEMFIVAPKGTSAEGPYRLFEYDSSTTLRDAVDALIASQGGLKVTMTDENLDEEYAPAMVDSININTFDFFADFLVKMPYLSLGLRWEPLHGEAWRFADVEMKVMNLAITPGPYDDSIKIWNKIDKHLRILKEIYLNAPQLSEISKEALNEMIKAVDQMKEHLAQHANAELP